MSLASEIKALLKRGDAAADAAAEKHYKAAGEKLMQLREDKTKAQFGKIVSNECSIKISWAYILMRMAKGETTLAKERATSAGRVVKHRNRKRPLRNGQKRERELAPELEGDTPQQQWEYSVGNMAGDAISLQAFWDRTFGAEWREFAVASDLVTLAQQAAEAWAAIADELTTRAGAIPIRRAGHGGD
jgi:hypothetical protein